MANRIGFLIEILGSAGGGQRAFQQTQTGASRLSSGMSALGKTFAIVGGAAALEFGRRSVKAFMEAEQASQRLEEAFGRYPQLADSSASAITRLAGSIASKTAAEDDSIVAGAAVLAQFKLTGTQLEQTLPLLVDYARKTGSDIPSAAAALGKAFLGKTRALTAVGIQFKDTGDASKNYEGITEALRAKVGGFAASELTTTAGKLENLKHRFGNLQEVVGGAVVGAFDFLTRNFQTLLPIIGFLTTALVLHKVATIATTIATQVFGVSAQAAWLAALGPIGLVVAAVVGIGLLIWRFRDTIMDALKAVGGFFVDLGNDIRNALVGAIAWVVDKYLAAFEWILRGAATAFGWIPGIGPKLKQAARAFETFRDSANEFILGIKDKTVTITVVTVGVATPGGGVGRMAAGGIVTRPTLALIGEAGPEAVVPLKAMGEMPALAGRGIAIGPVTIVVQGSDDPAATAREIRRELLKLGQRNLSVGLA